MGYFFLKIMDVPERRSLWWGCLEVWFTLFLIYSISRIEYTYRFLRFLLNIENQAKVVETYIGLFIILHLMVRVG